jgi:hypothetical protein
VALWTVGFDLLQLCASAPNWSDSDRAVEFDRLARPRERVEDAMDVGMPHSNIEIEIVRAISRRSLF